MSFRFDFCALHEGEADTAQEDVLAAIPAQRVEASFADLPSYRYERVLHTDLVARRWSDTFLDAPGLANEVDIIPREYEGGLKTWECSLDLLHYLSTLAFPAGMRIVELGCGSALPSISLARRDPTATVAFQDYNEHVLRSVTLPNLLGNVQSAAPCNYSFFCGDWDGLEGLLLDSCDLLLSSETIYHPSSYSKISRIIASCLAPTGTALVAAKEYYFGNTLGGGLHEFAAHIVAGGELSCRRVWQSSGGLLRGILEIRRKRCAE